MRHVHVLLAMVLTIVVLSSPASAEDDDTRKYCLSGNKVRRIINMYAVQEKLTLDEVTGTIVRASTALTYVESHRPEYLETHPNFHDWMQILANMDGLAVQIQAPGLTSTLFMSRSLSPSRRRMSHSFTTGC